MKKLLFLITILLVTLHSFSQKRITLVGKEIHFQGAPIYLHGANTIAETGKITEADAENFKLMGMNFVRLLIDIDAEADWNDTEGDGNFVKESAIDNWETVTSWFTSRNIWVVVEMRSNDYDLSDSDFWVPGSSLHNKWKKIWITLAARLQPQDYIACWAILAEHGQNSRVKTKDAFRPIMESLDSITGGNTPFSFGPKLNGVEFYDTAQYTDWYWPEYVNRIIYQVNHLHPKPYINNDPAKGYDPLTWWYHRTDGQDGDGADNDDSMHKAGTVAHLAPALAWRDYYNAPIFIDQWGCAFNQPGYLDYERDMLDICKENGNIPNTRWTYYMGNERGIMTEYYGQWELHAPLFDFFKLNYVQGMNWPYEVVVSDYNAADNHITTDAIGTNLPWNIDFKFSAPFACNKIELWNGNGDATEDPTEVIVYGSNDSLNWVTLATINGISFSGRRAQYFSASFNNTASFLYYSASFRANGGASTTVISNLEFFPGPVSDPVTASQKVATNPLQVRQDEAFIYIKLPDEKDTENNLQVSLYTTSGQSVYLTKYTSVKSELQISKNGLSSGMYILHIKNGKESYSQKIHVKTE